MSLSISAIPWVKLLFAGSAANRCLPTLDRVPIVECAADHEARSGASAVNPPRRTLGAAQQDQDHNGDSMTRVRFRKQMRAVLEIGCLPTDSEQERVTKEVFVIIAFGATAAGIVWAAMYLALAKPWSALLPLRISVATAPTIERFMATKRLGLLARAS